LVLNHPRISGALHGYPYEARSLELIARSPFARIFRALPSTVRRRLLRAIPLGLTASAAFAGPPAVAHAEALLRAIEARTAELDEPVDALVLGVPAVTPHLPREAPNPLLAAYLGLGLALRLWRDDFPVVEGGTVILVHRFRRRFPHPTQLPYRAFFQAVSPSVRDRQALAAGERAVLADRRAIDAYRARRSCHPLLPFLDWDACQPALERLGAVLVADCRDAAAARMLDFVPTHGIGAALAMAEGRAGRPPRLGFLLSPPYFPLRVGAVAPA
jgi:hypothetical protein